MKIVPLFNCRVLIQDSPFGARMSQSLTNLKGHWKVHLIHHLKEVFSNWKSPFQRDTHSNLLKVRHIDFFLEFVLSLYRGIPHKGRPKIVCFWEIVFRFKVGTYLLTQALSKHCNTQKHALTDFTHDFHPHIKVYSILIFFCCSPFHHKNIPS